MEPDTVTFDDIRYFQEKLNRAFGLGNPEARTKAELQLEAIEDMYRLHILKYGVGIEQCEIQGLKADVMFIDDLCGEHEKLATEIFECTLRVQKKVAGTLIEKLPGLVNDLNNRYDRAMKVVDGGTKV